MKKVIIFASILFAIGVTSCGSNEGPKGKVYVEERSIDEMVNDVLEAEGGNGWVYQHEADLHTMVDGDWRNAGRFPIFMNLKDDDDCNLWVAFDESGYLMPVYPTDDYGYRFKVQWQGDWYYF